MAKQDYYALLGVAKNASQPEIKKAFRTMARKFHPDKNLDDPKKAEEKFKDVQEAYKVLSNEQQRAAYDQFGHEGVNSGAGGQSAGAGGFGSFDDLGDIFGAMFGGRGQSRGQGSRAQSGDDLGYEMSLTLEEAIHGTEQNIAVASHVLCGPCEGSGAKKGSKPVTCSQCRGSGQMQIQHGFIAMQQPCNQCQGQGQVIKDPCGSCYGQGRIKERVNLAVKIPAGVDAGDRIRLSGKGEAGVFGGPSGDLYIQFTIKPHPIFERRDDDLYCEIPVGFTAAALGAEVHVPTISGQVKLTIPKETQSGKTFRLRGKGVKGARSHRTGDLLCKIVVETPVKLNEQQKKLLQTFNDSLIDDGQQHSPRTHSWFDAVKHFFNI